MRDRVARRVTSRVTSSEPVLARTWRPRAPLVIVGACGVVALVSMLVPVSLAYDSWAWLTWGRQVGRLALDTTRGPSWKPLPVIGTTVVAPFGWLAVPLWMVFTRTIGLLVLVAAYRLAARFAGWVAGAIAVILVLVSPDGDPRFLRLVFEGHTAPLTAALLLWAIDRHLDGRHTSAFLLGVLFSLDRPEAWPLLAVYALWLWRKDPPLRRLLVVTLPIIPLLWFGGDWWGSGSPMHGADAARVAAHSSNRTVGAIERFVDSVAAPAWLLAAFALFDARRRRQPALFVMAALALGWGAIVVLMTLVFGYAALSRFFLPGAVLICVLAGIGAVRAYESIVSTRGRVAFVVVLALVAGPFVVVRTWAIGSVFDEMRARERVVAGLDDAIARVGGRDAVLECGRIAISDLGVPRIALAWKLDVPIRATHRSLQGERGVRFVAANDRGARRAAEQGGLVELASTPNWLVFGADCGAHGD